MTAVMIIVGLFFLVTLGIMMRSERKSTERREINTFKAPKRRRTRALDGTYILK